MYKNLSKPRLVFSILISIIFIILTSISLIFINVPMFIYLNIIGQFIFSFIFGPILGIVFNILIALVKIKFGLVDEIINYTMFTNLCICTFVGIIALIKLSLNKKFLIYIFSIPILVKPISIFTYNLFINDISIDEILDLLKVYFTNNLLSSFQIYSFSAIVTYIIYRLLATNNKEVFKNGN